MKTPKINSRVVKLEVLKGTATRASVNAVESRTTSLESDVATARGDISTLQGNVVTLTQGIVDALSTHNTANDSHADIRADLAGTAATAVSTHNTATDSHADIRTAISDLMSNVEEVDADFVSISYNPSGGGGSGVTVPDPIREYALTADFSDSMGGSALTPTNAVISGGWAVLTDGYMQIPDGTDLAPWKILKMR